MLRPELATTFVYAAAGLLWFNPLWWSYQPSDSGLSPSLHPGSALLFIALSAPLLYWQLRRVRQRAPQEDIRLAENVASVSLWHWDFSSNKVHSLHSIAEQLGYSPDELADTPESFIKVLHPDDRVMMHDEFERVRQGKPPAVGVLRMWHKNGALRWVLNRVQQKKNSAGKVTGLVGATIDITEQHENARELGYLSHRDPITGFYNSRHLRRQTERAIAQASRNKSTLGLLLIDLDQFHSVNYGLGFAAGDRLLVEAGKRLQTRMGDAYLCRYNGDSFAILIETCRDAEHLESIATDILKLFSEPLPVEGRDIYLGVTVGGSLHPLTAKDADDLIRQTENALYRGKQDGRNCFVLYSGAMEEEELRFALYTNALRQALRCNEIDVAFQPQYDVASGSFVGVEALARWYNDSLGDVPPDVFFPVAARCGELGNLGDRVIRRSLAALASWHRDEHPGLNIAINISSRQLYARDFVTHLRKSVAREGVAPEQIELEITEADLARDFIHGTAIIRQLVRHGFRIVIDNFGSGSSSLSALNAINAYALKIDKALVRQIDSDPQQAKVVRAIIALAKSIDIVVIAEGVESAQQTAILQAYGCDRLQGYYFTQPLSADKIPSFLQSTALT